MSNRKSKSQSSAAKKPPPRDFVAEYARLEPRYQQFAQKVDTLIIELLRKHDISAHATEYRSKTIDSFSEKIQRPGKRYDDPLVELSDLAGNRVILYYQEDADTVCDILRSEFSVDDDRSIDKSFELDPDQFGYNSVHLVVELKDNRLALPEWESFAGLVTEIQVRTVLQHAWSAVSHSLQYKRESDIPTSLRRRINRLSGLFELADDEFSTMRTKRQQLEAKISDQLGKEILVAELNALSVAQYLADSEVAKSIGAVIKNQGVLKLEVGELAFSKDLLPVAQLVHVSTIQELDKRLQELAPHFETFFEEFAANQEYKSVRGDLEHWCAVILAAADHKEVSASELYDAVGWGKDYSKFTLKVGSSIF